MKRSTEIIVTAIKTSKLNPKLASSFLIDGVFAIEIKNAEENVQMTATEIVNDVIAAAEELEQDGIVRSDTCGDLKQMASEYLE